MVRWSDRHSGPGEPQESFSGEPRERGGLAREGRQRASVSHCGGKDLHRPARSKFGQARLVPSIASDLVPQAGLCKPPRPHWSPA